MSRYIVRADTVTTMDAAFTVIADGAVIVRDNRIEAVGPSAALNLRGPFDRELGGPGSVLIPGLVTAHHHTVGILRRAFAPIAFERREPIGLYMGSWTEEDLYWLNLYANLQLLKGGITTAITFFYGLKDQPDLGCEPVIRSFLDSGIRAGFGIAARDRWDVVHARDKSEFLSRLPSDVAQRLEESPFGYLYDTNQIEALSRRLAAKYQNQDGRFKVLACPDWTPSSTDELYARMKRLGRELNTPILTHLLETPYEMLHSQRTYGKSAVARLRDLDFLSPEVTCTDCVWLTDEDIRIMADTGTTAVYNPFHISGFNGIAPARQMVAAGVRVGFSILLRSLNDGYDTLFDLGLGERLQHLPGIAAEAMPAQEMLRMATVNGGYAWALDDSLGSLAEGKRADMVLLDKTHLYDDPFLDPACDIHRLLIYRGRAADVRTVIVEGTVVVENGRCMTADEHEALEHTRAGAARISADRAPIQPWLDLVRDLEPHVIQHYQDWEMEKALVPWGSYNTRQIRVPTPA
jgi:5-methylthioadenosine/S-adenosylhomocysteine deaminase